MRKMKVKVWCPDVDCMWHNARSQHRLMCVDDGHRLLGLDRMWQRATITVTLEPRRGAKRFIVMQRYITDQYGQAEAFMFTTNPKTKKPKGYLTLEAGKWLSRKIPAVREVGNPVTIYVSVEHDDRYGLFEEKA